MGQAFCRGGLRSRISGAGDLSGDEFYAGSGSSRTLLRCELELSDGVFVERASAVVLQISRKFGAGQAWVGVGSMVRVFGQGRGFARNLGGNRMFDGGRVGGEFVGFGAERAADHRLSRITFISTIGKLCLSPLRGWLAFESITHGLRRGL